MNVTGGAVCKGRTGSLGWCWMSGIELLSYSRRTPVMPDAPDETVSRESLRYGWDQIGG